MLSMLAMLALGGAQAATIELTVNGLVCGFCARSLQSLREQMKARK